MRYSDEARETLAAMAVEDIEKVKDGVYGDDVVRAVLSELSKDPTEETQPRSLALMKLLFRSPQMDFLYNNDALVYDLQDALVESGQGADMLYYALLAWVMLLRHHYWTQFVDYLNIARGFLYQGRGDVFAAYLKRALEETPLYVGFLHILIEDFARLGELDLARDLNAVGQQAEVENWTMADLSAYESENVESVSLDDTVRQAIREMITSQVLTDDDEAYQLPAMLDRSELEAKLSSAPSDEDRLLWVPDMLTAIMEEKEGLSDPADLPVVKALAALQASALPELSLLGDSLAADQAPVFYLSEIGKVCGYHFDSLAAMAMDPNLWPNTRGDAAKALMAVIDIVPEHRAAVLKILEDLLNTPDTPDGAGESLVTAVVADLHNTNLYELKPSVTRVFNEDRVSPIIIKPDSFTGPWNLSDLEDTLQVEGRSVYLDCHQCGRTREYAVDYVLVIEMENLHWDANAVFFDHLIKCKKCGAVEDYNLSPLSLLRLFPALFMPGEMEDPTRGLDEMLYFVPKPEDVFFSGYSPVILDEVRRKVVGQGMDALDPLSQGEYYRVAGNYEASLAAFRKAYDEDPGNRMAALALAMAEHDYGDKERARALYRQSVGKWTSRAPQQDPVNDVAMDGLGALADGKPSPYPYPRNRDKRSLFQRQKGGKRRRRR
jgi:tetratricopeptide (TPR) repeat protein